MTALEEHRRRQDEWFKLSPDSPIPPEEREAFQGLSYYPENLDLRMVLEIEEFPSKEAIQMLTSTGGVQNYLRWGKIHFVVDGQPATLTVFYSSWGSYFVPFVDATSGVETYGSGRYLELKPLDDGRFLADFNLAYNPYCAYSKEYSCPIPPSENRIEVAIRAGEKAYH